MLRALFIFLIPIAFSFSAQADTKACSAKHIECRATCTPIKGSATSPCLKACYDEKHQCQDIELKKLADEDRQRRLRKASERAEREQVQRTERQAEVQRQATSAAEAAKERAAQRQANQPVNCETQRRICTSNCKDSHPNPIASKQCSDTCKSEFLRCKISDGREVADFKQQCSTIKDRIDCQCMIPYVEKERGLQGPHAPSFKVIDAALKSPEANKACVKTEWVEKAALHQCMLIVASGREVSEAHRARCACAVPRAVKFYAEHPYHSPGYVNKILLENALPVCPGVRAPHEPGFR